MATRIATGGKKKKRVGLKAEEKVGGGPSSHFTPTPGRAHLRYRRKDVPNPATTCREHLAQHLPSRGSADSFEPRLKNYLQKLRIFRHIESAFSTMIELWVRMANGTGCFVSAYTPTILIVAVRDLEAESIVGPRLSACTWTQKRH